MKNSNVITFLLLVFGLLLFGWFAVRPAYIKHTCSWVKKHSDAVAAIPAMTKDDLISKGIIRSCVTEIANLKKVIPSANYELGTNNVYATSMSTIDGKFRAMSNDPLWQATSCIRDGDKIIDEYKNPRPAIPAKDWYEKATDTEYKFCLHNWGL